MSKNNYLVSQLYSFDGGFPTLNKEWDKSTQEQRDEWFQIALKQDSQVNEVIKLIHQQQRIINDALVAIYGNRTDYKGKPYNSSSSKYHKIWKYLNNDKNTPFSRHWHKYYENMWKKCNDSYLKRIKEKEQEAIQERRVIEQQKENVEKLKTMIEICIRNGIDTKYVPDAYTIQEELLSKNKYLALAMGGIRNRSDWNNGYDYAETALNSFVVETEIDELIAEEWYDICNYEDVDGRYFRDCEWNYDRLLSLVDDKQLVDDTMTINEFIEY